MDKSKLTNMINKYHLNGLVNEVNWNVADKGVKINFQTIDKSLIGLTASKDVQLPKGIYGIYNTKSLLKILSVLSNEVDISIDKSCITFQDQSVESKFMLANPDIINGGEKVLEPADIPEMDVQIPINSIFIDKFIKSKSALDESTQFAFITEENNLISLVLNYSDSHNTDRISIKTNIDYKLDYPIMFNSNNFKEVLFANKELEGTIGISLAGIMSIEFKSDTLISKYCLVALER